MQTSIQINNILKGDNVGVFVGKDLDIDTDKNAVFRQIFQAEKDGPVVIVSEVEWDWDLLVRVRNVRTEIPICTFDWYYHPFDWKNIIIVDVYRNPDLIFTARDLTDSEFLFEWIKIGWLKWLKQLKKYIPRIVKEN